MTSIAIIHTITATVDTFKAPANGMIPSWQVFNIVGDSILPLPAEDDGNLKIVEERMIEYARSAKQWGALSVLEACSSVGELVTAMEAGMVTDIKTALIEGAYQRLMAGDREGHDERLSSGQLKLAHLTNAVVLAQASMARWAPGLPQELQAKFLVSPWPAMEQIKRSLHVPAGH